MAIRTFWPEDDERNFYIAREVTLEQILERAAQKWPGKSLSQIKIEAEYTHTNALDYDLFDASDYTNFIHVSLTD